MPNSKQPDELNEIVEEVRNLINSAYEDGRNDERFGNDSINLGSRIAQFKLFFKAAIEAYTLDARIDEVKLAEREAGKRFDWLCERVRTEPNFGNSTKGKKDNFLDGAESMIILPSVRRAELEKQRAALTGRRGQS